MDIPALRQFSHLANSLHFGRTSRACHVSPSTLSRVIQRLEEESGARFFERDRRSVILTDAGKNFHTFATITIREWEILQEKFVDQAAELRGELSIFCSVTAAYSLLPNLLTEFRHRYPGVKISIVLRRCKYGSRKGRLRGNRLSHWPSARSTTRPAANKSYCEHSLAHDHPQDGRRRSSIPCPAQRSIGDLSRLFFRMPELFATDFSHGFGPNALLHGSSTKWPAMRLSWLWSASEWALAWCPSWSWKTVHRSQVLRCSTFSLAFPCIRSASMHFEPIDKGKLSRPFGRWQRASFLNG